MISRLLSRAVVLALAGGGLVGLFLTPDQQGQRLLERGDAQAAAEIFSDPVRRGVALFEAGDFAGAAGEFARIDTAEAWYNLGVASARQEQLEVALESFEKALEMRPDFEDAAFNLDLVQGLLDAEKEEDENEAPGGDPSFEPDEMVIDEEKAKKGKEGEVEMRLLSDEALDELWLGQLETTPADFLRRKFLVQAAEARE